MKTLEKRTKGSEFRTKGSSYALRPLLSTLCSLLLSLLLFCQVYASDIIPQTEVKIDSASKTVSKVKFTFGYDNNVSESVKDNIESRFYQLYLNSGMYVFPTENTLVSLRLQDGLKYLDSPSLSGESVLINNLSLYISQRISDWLIPEIQSEIMGRTSIHNESDVLPSEEAYLRGSAGIALKSMIYDDITFKAFSHYRFINFEDFDPFDRIGPLIGLRTDIRLLPGSTVGIQYSREKSHYNKWNIINPESEIKRSDMLDDIGLFVQFYKYLLFDITYSFQKNKSDMSGYSYRSNKLDILMARTFKWDIMFQLHGHIKAKRYLSQSNGSDSNQIDLEDDEREMLIAKISKEITQYCGLEAQYDFHRNKSSKENNFYTKSVFSLSLSLQF
jgi:hypothetical protein